MISVCLKTEKLSSRARAAAAAGLLLFAMAEGNCVGNAEVKLNTLLKTLVLPAGRIHTGLSFCWKTHL